MSGCRSCSLLPAISAPSQNRVLGGLASPKVCLAVTKISVRLVEWIVVSFLFFLLTENWGFDRFFHPMNALICCAPSPTVYSMLAWKYSKGILNGFPLDRIGTRGPQQKAFCRIGAKCHAIHYDWDIRNLRLHVLFLSWKHISWKIDDCRTQIRYVTEYSSHDVASLGEWGQPSAHHPV
jgi:hypothetical protein